MSLDPVHATVVVGRPLAEAFELFTDGVAAWWPLATHSVGADRAVSAVLEGRVGGPVYERAADGTEAEWGRVNTWEPPIRLVVSWHAGTDPDTPTEWEATFTQEGDDSTRAAIVHSGWERLGEAAAETRAVYDGGWRVALDAYAAAATGRAAPR